MCMATMNQPLMSCDDAAMIPPFIQHPLCL
jgi:hypothetical protein